MNSLIVTKYFFVIQIFSKGMLVSSKIDKFDREYLPYDLKGRCPNIKKDVPCFKAGDLRLNQNLLLTSLHLIFLREHNRIAEQLAKMNPYKYNSDEIIYQEARRINIAQYQHIVYEQFVPGLIGRRAVEIYELAPLYNDNNEYFMGYNAELYPSASIEFSTAAFRFGHTLVRPTLSYVDHEFKDFHQIQLNDAVFNPMG